MGCQLDRMSIEELYQLRCCHQVIDGVGYLKECFVCLIWLLVFTFIKCFQKPKCEPWGAKFKKPVVVGINETTVGSS